MHACRFNRSAFGSFRDENRGCKERHNLLITHPFSELSANNAKNQLTPWSKVLFEKLTVTQLVKKFPAFYGTQGFITVFTTARHWSLS
jgi:hypothetical protein